MKKKNSIRRAQSVAELTRQNVETITQLECAAERKRTPGDKVADIFAAVIGSWTFIIIQSVILGAWVTLNLAIWINHWDPYPFTFLNLVLSFQAAYASPIIMMSQNRQSRLSEQRNRLDLQINLLTEQENTEMLTMLRLLCEKVGVPISDRAALQVFEEATKPGMLVGQIEASDAQRRGGMMADDVSAPMRDDCSAK